MDDANRTTASRPSARVELSDEEIAGIPRLYAQEGVEDPIVYAKFFDPCSSWTWFLTEYDPEEQIAFGHVRGHEDELGYFSLVELAAVRNRLGIGIERDVWFTPKPLSEALAAG